MVAVLTLFMELVQRGEAPAVRPPTLQDLVPLRRLQHQFVSHHVQVLNEFLAQKEASLSQVFSVNDATLNQGFAQDPSQGGHRVSLAH